MNIEYDTSKTYCSWFKLRGIQYNLNDCVVINGEKSEIFYGLISKIIANRPDIEVTWFYLPSEMVMSAKEKNSVHANEIFYTLSKDVIDIETIQMKAPIYLLEKNKSIPHIPKECFILRRMYDPFKTTLSVLQIEKERIQHLPKLQELLCSYDDKMYDSDTVEAKENRSPQRTPLKKQKLKVTTPKTNKAATRKTDTTATPTSRYGRNIKPVLSPQSISIARKRLKETTPKTDKPVTRKTTTPTTRSGRNIKPVEIYHGLNQSLAMEAQLKSNVKRKSAIASRYRSSSSSSTSSISSTSSSDSEVSVMSKDAKKGVKKTVLIESPKKTTKKTPKTSSVSYRKTPKRSSVSCNKNVTKPKPKVLKSDKISTPSSVPIRLQKGPFAQARSRLHVSAVPETLPCREDQFADIFYFLESKLDEGTGGCMYISGVPGTGKTATVHDVLKSIGDKCYKYQIIEINGMKISEPKHIYSFIYKQLEGKKVTPDHAALLLGEYFGKHEKQSVVLIVDELDLLWTRKQHVMYNLFDWPNRANSKLVVLAIANTMDLPERMLMNRVASRLGLTRMTFQPYTHKELHEILNSRIQSLQVFAPEAVMLASRKVAAASGDARRALDMCRLALDIAEKSDSAVVTSNHIQQSIINMYHSMKSLAIMNCTMYEKLFLKSILAVFKRKGVEESVFKEVYEVFCSLCHFQGYFSPPCSSILQLCSTLGACRIILVEPGYPSLHTHIRLNCSQDDVIFGLKEDKKE